MRYFLVRGPVTVRAFGRRNNWRCRDCIAGGRMLAARMSGEGMLPADWLRRYADLAADLDCLCMQLHIVGEAVADDAEAATLGNVIRLSGHRAQRTRATQRGAAARLEEAIR